MRNHLEKLLPVPDHDLLGLLDIPFPVDEGVVFRHQLLESFQVTIVDAFVEVKSDEFGVFGVQRAKAIECVAWPFAPPLLLGDHSTV